MGWDHGHRKESSEEFLLRLLGIDARAVIAQLIDAQIRERKLDIRFDQLELEDGFGHPGEADSVARCTVTHDNGTQEVYVQKLVRAVRYDDSGVDYYEFRPAAEQTKPEYIYPLENAEDG